MGMCLDIDIKHDGLKVEDIKALFPEWENNKYCYVEERVEFGSELPSAGIVYEGSYGWGGITQDRMWEYAHSHSTEEHPVYLYVSDFESPSSFYKVIGKKIVDITEQEYFGGAK